MKFTKLFIACCAVLAMVTSAMAQTNITPNEARAIAREAYTYGFPIAEAYNTLYKQAIDTSNSDFKAPINQIGHSRGVASPQDNWVVTPNSDTPYSFLWADLRAEPVVITMPKIETQRYYTGQMIDLYTHNFAYLGTRAFGNDGGNFLIAGPGWNGKKPDGIRALIRCETELFYVLFRTQLFNAGDLENVNRIQDGMKVQPLSQFMGKAAPKATPAITWPKPVEGMTKTPAIFGYLNFMLQFTPTHASEKELMARFGKLGIGAGKPFDFAKMSPELQKAIEGGIADVWQKDFIAAMKRVNAGEIISADLFGTRDYLKNNYLYRFLGAKLGLYANSAAEAMYPPYYVDAQNEKLDAAKHSYELQFAKGQLPPAGAFWSLTMYDGKSQLLVANPLNRYLLNSTMLDSFKYDDDGSLSIYIGKTSPGTDKESNWLPAPDGPFYCILRIYMPKPEVLNGTWKAPAMKQVKTRVTEDKISVTKENYARVMVDFAMQREFPQGANNTSWHHHRKPMELDKQPAPMMNKDTLYSFSVIDGGGDVAITLPETDGRYQSLHLWSDDHITYNVYYGAGRYVIPASITSNFFVANVRTQINPKDPEDVKKANSYQDQLKVEFLNGYEPKPYEATKWNMEDFNKLHKHYVAIAQKDGVTGTMGTPDNPVSLEDRNRGVSTAIGLLPDTDAVYLTGKYQLKEGQTLKATYPVPGLKDSKLGFYSITMYGDDQYLHTDEGSTISNSEIKLNPDGKSFDVYYVSEEAFGKNANELIVPTETFNITLRIYLPDQSVQNGEYKLPVPAPVKTRVTKEKIAVTEENYKVAESDYTFNGVVKYVGTNKWMHENGLAPLDQQKVVRQNRDTIYSYYIADVSEGATITLPESPDGRYISAMVIQNDHYIEQVFTTPGTHKVDSKTDFVAFTVRIQVNPYDPDDMDVVRSLQAQIKIDNPSKREHVLPNYDLDQMVALRNKLVEEGQKFGSLNNMQGKRDEIDPRMHLLGTALGYGLFPDKNAQYISFFPKGAIASADVCSKATFYPPPINKNGFYSITMYGDDGYIKNENSVLNRYNLKYKEDGSFEVHFGNCPKDVENHLPTTKGWNFLLRAYEPKLEQMKDFKLPTPVLVEVK